MNNSVYFYFIVLFLLIAECNPSDELQDPGIRKYLLTGHTYSWAHSFKVDEKIGSIPQGYFDGFWLGGDILSETTLNNELAEYLDSIFNLKNPMTHFAYGNHDARNGNKRFFNTFRLKDNSFYTHSHEGLCFLILDTTLNPLDCSGLEAQYSMIQHVCDTIRQSSHLLLLMHDSVWDGVPGLPDPNSYANGNQKFWNPDCGSSTNTFASRIYPMLVAVQQRGVQVICMMGDTGWKKGGAFKSDDGVQFIASGINNSYYLKDPDLYKQQKPDIVYVFTHNIHNRSLSWKAIELNNLDSYIRDSGIGKI